MDHKSAKAFGSLCGLTIKFYNDITHGISPTNGIADIPLVIYGEFCINNFLLNQFSEYTKECGLTYMQKVAYMSEFEILKEIGLI